MNLMNSNFEGPVEELRSEVRANSWMHCLISDIKPDSATLSKEGSKRNLYEFVLSSKIEHYLLNSDKLIKQVTKTQAVGQKNDAVRQAINNWINNNSTIDDFRLNLPQVDLRVVTGLKYQVIETSPEEQHK